MKKVLNIAIKEGIHIIRDRRALILTLIFPAFTVLFLGYAITLDIKNLKIAVYNEDKGLSEEIVDKLIGSPFFSLTEVHSLTEGEKLLRKGKAVALLWFNDKFTQSILRGTSPEVLMLIDGSNNNSATIAQGYIFSALQNLNRSEKLPSFLFLFNPSLDTRKFFVPGIIGIFLFILSVAMTTLSITREKEIGTIEGLIASPLMSHQIIFGKVLPYIIIGLIDFSIALFFAYLLFGIRIEGSIFELYLTTGLFILCGVSIGLFISSWTGSTMSAWLLSFIVTVLPSLILSDFVFLTRSMPSFIEKISMLIPTLYYIRIIRSIIMKGAHISSLKLEIFALTSFFLLFLLLSILRLRKKLS